MGHSKILTTLLITVLMTTTTTHLQLPFPDKVYVIRSTMDGGIVKPIGNGKVCQGLSRVQPTYDLNVPYPPDYQWIVSAPNNFTGGVSINSNVQVEGFIVNDITFDDFQSTCYPVYRDLLLSPSGDGNSFMVMNIRNGLCLTTYGSGVGNLFWVTCGIGGQNWNFIESAPVDVKL